MLMGDNLMSKVLEGVTIETFPEVARTSQIRPGQRFAIVLEGKPEPRRPRLAEIAEKMRATAAARGMTTEVFDAIIAKS
jgi:hypothetical protein